MWDGQYCSGHGSFTVIGLDALGSSLGTWCVSLERRLDVRIENQSGDWLTQQQWLKSQDGIWLREREIKLQKNQISRTLQTLSISSECQAPGSKNHGCLTLTTRLAGVAREDQRNRGQVIGSPLRAWLFTYICQEIKGLILSYLEPWHTVVLLLRSTLSLKFGNWPPSF